MDLFMIQQLMHTAIIAAVIMVACVVVVGPLARAIGKRLEGRTMSAGGLEEIKRRLDRIEHSIESISVEVERVGESHRFTARLLSDREQGGNSRILGRLGDRDR